MPKLVTPSSPSARVTSSSMISSMRTMPACPAAASAVALHAAEADEIGAERDRLDDIGAAIEAAVDDDHGAAGDRFDDFRQHVHRTAAVVELAAAVIGDVDDLDAVIERDLGVFRGADALDAERNFELRFHALDGAPIERHLELAAGGAAAAAGGVALGEIALAPAVMGGIDGETERGIAVA